MTDRTDLIDRYIAIWNETDAARRRDLIARTWTEAATYVDPMLRSQGRAEIDAMVAAVQAKYPGHRFRRTSAVDAHNDRVRFAWELAPEDGPTLVKGVDFAVIGGPGERLAAVIGFFDA
jgi:hypothetical protein